MAREVQIERFLSRERNLLAARGCFGPLFDDYRAHSRRYVGDPEGLVLVMMKQGLAAGALYLTCRPADEQTAWTINFPEPPLNIFITVDAGQGAVVGRYFDEHVQSADTNRLFVQTVRRRTKPYLSVLEVRGFDILQILEQYYTQSEQASVRFFEGPDDQYAMLMALPGIDEAWLRGLSREEGLRFADWPDLHLIERRATHFGCLCDPARIVTILTSLFHEKRDELFAGDPDVEVQCPRCGRTYRISREAFDQQIRQSDAEEGPSPGGSE